jgi:hypothetical protein
MAKRRPLNPFPTLNPHAAGIDIGATHHVVPSPPTVTQYRCAPSAPSVVTCTRWPTGCRPSASRQPRGEARRSRSPSDDHQNGSDDDRGDVEDDVDAATPVDAQNAPTGVWKSRNQREIPTAPTSIIVLVEEEERRAKPLTSTVHRIGSPPGPLPREAKWGAAPSGA